MIDNLKAYFPSLEHYTTIPAKLNNSLKWFLTSDSQLVGIHPDELQEKDLLLLSTFLTPYHNLFPSMTEEEKQWKNWIHTDEYPNNNSTFRFVYFQLPSKQIELSAFKSAINQLFEREFPILWENEQEGIIIESFNRELEDTISYKEIIDILISDLYINIRFFVGPYFHSNEGIKKYYQQIKAGAKLSFKCSQLQVITFLEAIPHILVDHADSSFNKDLPNLILQEFQDDKEFITMMEVFFKSNLNVSVAAKKLYMHRNSLQYRIDKYYEKTGIDVRIFHQALTVYLAILALNK
ncbi:helix-turn-helix domain-containing protein [Ornithinibacillus massiliensis]|uniref:Helix-turn-helix domain-containing protein n=1 Tax=Ornithinibacillus massiliensis TaxID=1944633 RepID=A0ABS5ME21_9BACI|nr:helix-turn-helix domain-containing protein [Ornithinibacillus massiliensis]MBS3680550.1 helix-turn-helix domain-containing protein [Ornithinibacillus massiliensis]